MTTTAQAAEKKSASPPAKTGAPAPKSAQSSITATAKSLTEAVETSINAMVANGRLDLPSDYSVDNALKSAYLALQAVEDRNGSPALSVCTRESVANALLDMVVQGLNVGKDQGYFVVFGNQLVFMRSYFGSMAVAERVNPNIKSWGHEVVYLGDTFSYEIKYGKKIVKEHVQKLENVNPDKMLAAYCVALDANGNPIQTEISTIDQIHQAWKQSKVNPFENGKVKAGSTHGKFGPDMAIRTIVNKTCKFIINASSDNELLRKTYNKTHETIDSAEVKAEITDKANKGPLIEASATAASEDTGDHRTTTESEQAQAEQTAKQYACPNNEGQMVMGSLCEGCGTRKGCPAHEAEDKQAGPADEKGPGY